MKETGSNTLSKRYGLLTAICMVVGTVIGSGVFFKASRVLETTNGSMWKTLLTVALVGFIMLICAYVFSLLAQKYSRVNGIVDYAEATCGKAYAYGVGWFMTTLYYPTMTSCLVWVSAQYTCQLFGWDVESDVHLVIALLYLVSAYAVNTLSPKIAGKLQVSATFVKLVPLVFMAIVGTAVGLFNGNIAHNIQYVMPSGDSSGGIMSAIVAFAFAYEGWIITTSINAELKNPKKTLPRALIIGCLITIVVYVAYFLGLMGSLTVEEIMGTDHVSNLAFSTLFGNEVFGVIAQVFIVISCLGTVNGLMLGCVRGMYSIAARGQGPAQKAFSRVDETTGMPTNSAIFALVICTVWLFQWEMGYIRDILPAFIAWENDELPIITIYAAYIPIFAVFMIKSRGENVFNRFIMPMLAIISCIFMVVSAAISYKIEALYYLIVFALIMLAGYVFYGNGKKRKNNN